MGIETAYFQPLLFDEASNLEGIFVEAYVRDKMQAFEEDETPERI
jgi:hypothetical protein